MILDVNIGTVVVDGVEVPRVRVGVVNYNNHDRRVVAQLQRFFRVLWADAGVEGQFRVVIVPERVHPMEVDDDLPAPPTPERVE